MKYIYTAIGITEEKQTGLEYGKCVTPHNHNDERKQTFLEDLKKVPLIVRVAGTVRAMVMSKGKQAGLKYGKDLAPHT